MSRREVRPEDLGLIRWPQEACLSPNGDRVAWTEISLDAERDEPVSQIFVALADASVAPRAFTTGPHDFSPQWSHDGRYLGFLAADAAPPQLRIASLEGGEPETVATPGPVKGIGWSPQESLLVLVVNIDPNRPAEPGSPRALNAPREIRGWFNRFDGAGWLSGRDHLFSYDVERRELRQLTDGDYDHSQPDFSPDGASLVFVSDRSSDRDDRHETDLWVISLRGPRRRRRLTSGIGWASYPTYSPDGKYVAFCGLPNSESTAGRDSRLMVVASDGSDSPSIVVPKLDRPVAFGLGGRPLAWVGRDELVFTVADRGAIHLRRALLTDNTARMVLGGDRQVTGISAVRLNSNETLLAYTFVWVDEPPEIYTQHLGRRSRPPRKVSSAGDALLKELRLLPTRRYTCTAPDGLEIEYFAILPAGARGRGATPRPPLYLDVHGGPHLYNPICEEFFSYQAMAAAGYTVILPNPRGSNSYGESFTLLARGEWGEGPYTDLMTCVDDALRRNLADRRKQFVGGYSYGGYMSSWIVGHTKRFKAAAIGAPVTDFVSLFGTWDGGRYLADALQADPWTGYEHLRAESPLTYAGSVTTPVYLYVNDGDMRCPPTQTDEFYAALKWHRKEVTYVRYPGGSHLSAFPTVGPPSQNIDRLQRILSWYAAHGGIKVRR
jgi:dipeptidyl aminopeptidase/acylaminoacyl peptidase